MLKPDEVTKEQIGSEIEAWMCHDPKYCAMLLTYARVQDLITQEELDICTEDLRIFYESLVVASDDVAPTKIPKKYSKLLDRRINE